MKNRVRGAVLSLVIPLTLSASAAAAGVYQGHMAGGVLADDAPEIYQGYMAGGLLSDSSVCLVTFNVNAPDAAISETTKSVSGVYGELPEPVRPGYVFRGWYCYQDSAWITPATPAPVSGTRTLYAQWEAAAVFQDVPSDSCYFEAVNWAIHRGITTGTSPSTFSPNDPCKRKYILTFLWRANGCPEPENSPVDSYRMADTYEKGGQWAMEHALVSEQEFRDGETASTRADTVMYLWKLAGSPAVENLPATLNRFTDVSEADECAQAVAWALRHGITNGTTDVTFSPERTCTRGQIVTFLYRCYAD